jgi:hypothetical protein
MRTPPPVRTDNFAQFPFSSVIFQHLNKCEVRVKILLAVAIFISSSLYAQQPAHPPTKTSPASKVDTSLLVEESANLKTDLAQLRALLNVLASQESGTDSRTGAALQTNRQMWQVVIARLAELTQRIDALEQKRDTGTATPSQVPQH